MSLGFRDLSSGVGSDDTHAAFTKIVKSFIYNIYGWVVSSQNKDPSSMTPAVRFEKGEPSFIVFAQIKRQHTVFA